MFPLFYFHTEPRPYQLEQFERSKDMEFFGILWDMRLGKSKLVIDTFSYLCCQKKKADAVIIISKANVCRNWELIELEKHMMPDLWGTTKVVVFQTRHAKTKRQELALRDLVSHKFLSILIISFDAFVTEAGKQAVWHMLKKREVVYIVDESARIKTPGAERTRAIVRSSKYAPYRRIMTGTPFTNKGPFDAYSQMKFLDNKFWARHGLMNFGLFKNFFGIWETRFNGKTNREFQSLQAYKNLHLLKQWLEPYTSRIMKEDVFTFPGKEYTKIYFELTSEQWKVYNQLRSELFTELEGRELAAPLALTRLLRFQQITCGYLPDPLDEEGKTLLTIGKRNPRLQALVEHTEDIACQGLIWCKFTQDVNLILEKLGSAAQRYDGLVKEHHRPEIITQFKKEKFQWLVAKATCLGEGVTLDNADMEIYYSNTFSLMDRIQSEDRPVLVEKKYPVTVVDMVGDAPIDEHIIQTLRNHQSIAEAITGDKIKSWI